MDESSAPGDLAALRGALVGTLGASKEARIGAELALEDWSAAPGYPVALLSVACAAARGDGAERAAAVAQAAAIAFKNYVDHSEWYERLPEEARRGVQEALLACLWSGAAAASPKLWLVRARGRACMRAREAALRGVCSAWTRCPTNGACGLAEICRGAELLCRCLFACRA